MDGLCTGAFNQSWYIKDVAGWNKASKGNILAGSVPGLRKTKERHHNTLHQKLWLCWWHYCIFAGSVPGLHKKKDLITSFIDDCGCWWLYSQWIVHLAAQTSRIRVWQSAMMEMHVHAYMNTHAPVKTCGTFIHTWIHARMHPQTHIHTHTHTNTHTKHTHLPGVWWPQMQHDVTHPKGRGRRTSVSQRCNIYQRKLHSRSGLLDQNIFLNVTNI